MGRKKAAAEAEAPADATAATSAATSTEAETSTEAPTEGKVNKMEAVRGVLATDPDASPADIVASLARDGIEISEKTAQVYRSKIRSGGSGASGTGEGRTRARATTKRDPSLSDLFEVRQWLDDQGESFDATAKLVEGVTHLAAKVGGLDNL